MITSGWGEDDHVIRCILYAGRDIPGVIYINCEACGAKMGAAPITVEKQKLPGWHVVCEKCFEEVEKETEVRYAGTFNRGATELPTDVN